MKIFPKMPVKILAILINTKQALWIAFKRLYFLTALRKCPLWKGSQQREQPGWGGLIWVLFSRHTLKRGFTHFEHSIRRVDLPLPVFISWTDCGYKMISEKDAEGEEVNRRTGVTSSACLLRACTASSTVALLALCGWLPDFKCSAALAPRALTVCFLHFKNLPVMSLWPFKQRSLTTIWWFKECYLTMRGLYEAHPYVTPLIVVRTVCCSCEKPPPGPDPLTKA